MQSQVRERREIEVQGIVQGVGFRPFVYALARRHGLSGWVRNDASGVHVEVEGAPAELEFFCENHALPDIPAALDPIAAGDPDTHRFMGRECRADGLEYLQGKAHAIFERTAVVVRAVI